MLGRALKLWCCVALLLAVSFVGRVAAQSYTIDPKTTVPSFEVRHLLIAKQRGHFGGTSGTIEIDREAKRGSIDITIDATQVDTGGDGMDEYLRAEDFFDVARYPTVHYRSDQLIFDEDRLVGAQGMLSMRGVTRPVRLAIKTFHCSERICNADASARIERSEFGMTKWFPWVSNEVLLRIQVEAVKD